MLENWDNNPLFGRRNWHNALICCLIEENKRDFSEQFTLHLFKTFRLVMIRMLKEGSSNIDAAVTS